MYASLKLPAYYYDAEGKVDKFSKLRMKMSAENCVHKFCGCLIDYETSVSLNSPAALIYYYAKNSKF